MHKAFHFYQVFNPMLNEQSLFPTQAHEFYFELKRRYHENQGQSNFLHWGKVSVTEAQEKVEYFKDALESNKAHGLDTHLYLTDYHHFWIAKVTEVKTELIDNSQTLPFYENKNVSIWFKVEDFDLLSAEFSETTHYISCLYLNNKFNDLQIPSLNPYIGGLHFPLIIQDHNQESYFQSGLRVLRENMLIESPSVQAKLREQVTSFVLPPHIFKQLSFEGQQGILVSEQLLNQVKSSPQVRETVFFNYISVMEESLNLVIGNILRETYAKSLWVSEKGDRFSEEPLVGYIPVGNFDSPIKLEGYFHLLQTHKAFGNLTMNVVENEFSEVVNYFLKELKPFLESQEVMAKISLSQENQPLILTANSVYELRNFVLGVGCLGVVNTLLGQRIVWLGNSKLLSA